MSRNRNRNQKPSIDPVILIAAGIVLVTIAIVMIVFQSKTYDVNIANNSGAMSQTCSSFHYGAHHGWFELPRGSRRIIGEFARTPDRAGLPGTGRTGGAQKATG